MRALLPGPTGPADSVRTVSPERHYRNGIFSQWLYRGRPGQDRNETGLASAGGGADGREQSARALHRAFALGAFRHVERAAGRVLQSLGHFGARIALADGGV